MCYKMYVFSNKEIELIKLTDEDPAKPVGQRGTIQVQPMLRINHKYLIITIFHSKPRKRFRRSTGIVQVIVVLLRGNGLLTKKNACACKGVCKGAAGAAVAAPIIFKKKT